MKYLINNADDFGWGIDITNGIWDSYKKGVLSSASVLINEIDKESLVVAKNSESLGLGLHLNIATGPAVSAEWEKKYGKFSHPTRQTKTSFLSQEMWEDHYGKFETSDVYSEFDAQLLLFKSLLGKLPDHLDTHYNTFCVRPVFDAYKKLAKKYSLPVRHPVGYRKVSEGDFKNTTAELTPIENFIDALRREKILVTTYFSLEYINLHPDPVAAMLSEVEKIKDEETIEISFHPGYREDWRVSQVHILTNPQLKEELKKANVKVINYRELHEYSKTIQS